MNLKKIITIGAIAASTLVAVAPANAVVTTFASFNALAGGNVFYLNNGTGGNNTNYRSNGFGGTIATTNSAFAVRPATAVPGAVGVTFSFLQAGLSGVVSNLPALFTLSGTVSNSPVTTFSGFKVMSSFTGTFSFLSSQAVTVGATTYAAGSNLLSGSFTDASIFGQSGGTSGSFGASTPMASISYTSDFLSFANTNDRDMSLSLSAITSLLNNVNKGLNNATGRGLRSFRATATGSFSSDPAPLVTAVPEPASWLLMIAGFGMVGVSARRRNRQTSVVA